MISLLLAAAVAATPAPAEAAPSVAGVTVERKLTKAELRAEKKRIRDNELICKMVRPTGSALPVQDCRTRRQMDEERAEFERERDMMMRRPDPGALLGRR